MNTNSTPPRPYGGPVYTVPNGYFSPLVKGDAYKENTYYCHMCSHEHPAEDTLVLMGINPQIQFGRLCAIAVIHYALFDQRPLVGGLMGRCADTWDVLLGDTVISCVLCNERHHSLNSLMLIRIENSRPRAYYMGFSCLGAALDYTEVTDMADPQILLDELQALRLVSF
jgi:hypothetical protein